METTIYITATTSEMESLFNKHINHNADIRFYQFVAPTRCKVVIRHCDGVILKESATYSLKGFLARCETKLDKLKRKLSDLESKLFDERCKQNEMLERRGFGYGMRHSKIGFSTSREDSIKERIEKVKEQIKQLSNI
jgi:hypothetical protein